LGSDVQNSDNALLSKYRFVILILEKFEGKEKFGLLYKYKFAILFILLKFDMEVMFALFKYRLSKDVLLAVNVT
jgi:hypothetical protein